MHNLDPTAPSIQSASSGQQAAQPAPKPRKLSRPLTRLLLATLATLAIAAGAVLAISLPASAPAEASHDDNVRPANTLRLVLSQAKVADGEVAQLLTDEGITATFTPVAGTCSGHTAGVTALPSSDPAYTAKTHADIERAHNLLDTSVYLDWRCDQDISITAGSCSTRMIRIQLQDGNTAATWHKDPKSTTGLTSGHTTAGTVISFGPANTVTFRLGWNDDRNFGFETDPDNEFGDGYRKVNQLGYELSGAKCAADDTTDPTVTSITAADDSLETGTETTVTVEFSEPVSGFALSDVTVTPGNTANASAYRLRSLSDRSLSPRVYTFKFSASAVDTYVLSIPANAVTDGASNGNTASASGANETITTMDTTDPTVSSITAAPDSVPVGVESTVTVRFSETVTGFALADVTVTPGNTANASAHSLTAFAGSGGEYTFKFSATAIDTYVLSLAANVVQDGAGNDNEASASGVNETITVTAADTTRPTVTSITAAPDSVRTGVASTVTFVFSEAVSGFALSDVTITPGNNANASAGSLASLSGSGTTYTARFTATAADTYTLSLAANRVTDAANNGNEASASGVNETITVTAATTQPPADTTKPTVTSITARPDSLLTNAVSTVTFVFSEAVSGFALSDVTITPGNNANASAGSLASLSGSGTTYTARFTATAADTYTLSLAANVVTDAANNGNTASASGVNETITVTAPIPDTFFTGTVSVTSSDDLDTEISNRNHTGTTFSVQVSPVGNRTGCSPYRSVSLRLAANGSASAQVANLVNSPAGGAGCSYTVRFPSSVRSATNTRVLLVGQGAATATLSASATTATRAYEADEFVEPPVVFAVSVANASSVAEGESLVFGVNVPGPAPQAVVVNYNVSGAAAGAAAGAGSVTIAAGQSSTEISIPTTDDDLDGANQTVRVTLTSASGGSTIIDPQGSTATGFVKDNDSAPVVSLTETSINIDRLTLAVELSKLSSRDVRVSYSTTVGNGVAVVKAGQQTASAFVVFGADRLTVGGALKVRLVSAQNATINVDARERLVRDPLQTWQFHITSRAGVTPRQIAAGLEFESGWSLFSWSDASQRWNRHTAASRGTTALAAGTTVVFLGADVSETMLATAGLGRSASFTLNPGWNVFTPAAQALGLSRDDFTTTSAGGSGVFFDPALIDCSADATSGVLVIYTYDQSDPQAIGGFRIALPCHPELQANFDIPAIASIDERDTVYAWFHNTASVELTFTGGRYAPA